MFRGGRIFVTAALTLGAVSTCLAKENGIPTINVQSLCKQNDAAIRGLFSDITQDYFSICTADEQGAREQIVKEWGTFSAPARTRCLKPADFLPSYVEWLQCLEMDRDVAQLRKEQPVSAISPKARSQCPIVSQRADGFINWVIACDLNK